MSPPGYDIGQTQSYDCIRHTSQTTETKFVKSDFVTAVHISTALKWHADMSMLKCRHVNVREKFQV